MSKASMIGHAVAVVVSLLALVVLLALWDAERDHRREQRPKDYEDHNTW